MRMHQARIQLGAYAALVICTLNMCKLIKVNGYGLL